MKPVDVKSNTYIVFNKKNNNEDPKSRPGDHVRVSIYKSIFAKGYVPNWSEKVSVIKKFENTMTLLVTLTVKKLLGRFTKKSCKLRVIKL